MPPPHRASSPSAADALAAAAAALFALFSLKSVFMMFVLSMLSVLSDLFLASENSALEEVLTDCVSEASMAVGAAAALS